MKGPSPLTAPQLIQAGQHHHAGGNLAAAQECYLQALELQPTNPHIHYLLGMIALAGGDGAAAVEMFGSALQHKPREPIIRAQLAQALLRAGRDEEAIAMARLNVSDGGGPEGQYLLALILCQLRRHDEALPEAERALALRPSGIDEMLLLSALHPVLGRWDDARKIAEDAVRAHPQVPETQRNHAIACLIHGDMPRGWDAFEHRPELQHPPGTQLWRDEDVTDKTVLVYSEGGFGDAIQFARYVPMLKQRAKKVILACPPELLDLFKENIPADEIGPQDAPWPASDFVCPLPSLPFHFRTTLQTIPRDRPYLRASARRAATWEPYMPREGGLKVGLSWAGSNVADKQRSRTLLTFAALADVPRVRFYSLQKGAESWQAAAPPANMQITDFMPRVRDFADLAGVIENLDLVISVDTAVAHLAGAMGTEVWTLIPNVPDFRWMLDRADTPWYPTMRLYRQTTRGSGGDWSAVMARIAADLRQKASENNS
jgi:tetratricopeptide (TPR) repeat protein